MPENQKNPGPYTVIPMNTLDYDAAVKELGEEAIGEIREFHFSMFGSRPNYPEEWRARFAPSLVTRSELEVFGQSMPRFVVRVYTDRELKFFFNVRRLKTFARLRPQFGRRFLLRDDFHNAQLRPAPKPHDTPSDLLRGQPSIADCYLPVPSRVRESFHVITTSIAAASGEVAAKEHEYAGSPYVKHIYLTGGGLCAQACCYMATALLQRHAKTVCGIAEITHYATNSAPQVAGGPRSGGLAGVKDMLEGFRSREMAVGGLNILGMVRYFEAVGLRAVMQKAPFLSRVPEVNHFYDAMRAYVLSGLPVVQSVDCARMAGNFGKVLPQRYAVLKGETASLYELNSVEAPQLDKDPNNRHAVLVVGANPDSGQRRSESCPNAPELCFHDPLSRPYMRASAIALARAAVYDDKNANKILDCMFLPVTPSQVRLPLGWIRASLNDLIDAQDISSNAPDKDRRGLMHLAFDMQVFPWMFPEEELPRLEPDCHQFEHVRLFQIENIFHVLESLSQEPANYLAGAEAEVSRKNLAGVLHQKFDFILSLFESATEEARQHWVWGQWTPHSVWIYDAEQELPDEMEFRDWPHDAKKGFLRLLVTQEKNGALWQLRPVTPNEPTGQPTRPGQANAPAPSGTEAAFPRAACQGCEKIASSLITSATVQRSSDILAHWPDELCDGFAMRVADLYTFMQADAEHFLLPHLPKVRPVTPEGAPFLCAREMMAALAERDGVIAHLAQEIINQMGEVRIVAFASFLSEIISVDRSNAKSAKNAIRFLIRLARALQNAATRQPVHAIEIVGGSLIQGIWPAYDDSQDPPDNIHAANILSPDKAIHSLVSRLRPLATLISETHNGKELHLALELEPGPLYTLGQWDRIRKFCHLLSHHESLSRFVGLNIDIPHWAFLAQINLPALLKDFAHKPPSDAAKMPKEQLFYQDMFYRIVHAHISDHSRGHFSDGVPLSIHQPEHLLPWLRLLAARKAANKFQNEGRYKNYPQYSGCVAIELEAAKSREMMHAACRNTQDLIRRI